MISAFNLRDIQEPVEGDLGTLKLYLQQIVGQPFLFLRDSTRLLSPTKRALSALRSLTAISFA